jgi:hypothetical protein
MLVAARLLSYVISELRIVFAQWVGRYVELIWLLELVPGKFRYGMRHAAREQEQWKVIV